MIERFHIMNIKKSEIRKAHTLTVLKRAVLKINPVWWHNGEVIPSRPEHGSAQAFLILL